MKSHFYVFLLFSSVAFGQAKLFEPKLISDGQSFGLTISPDGRDLFFVKAFGGRDTLQIYHSEKINGQWQKPMPAAFADTTLKQIDPAFSPDGNTILYNSLTSGENGFDVTSQIEQQQAGQHPKDFPIL